MKTYRDFVSKPFVVAAREVGTISAQDQEAFRHAFAHQIRKRQARLRSFVALIGFAIIGCVILGITAKSYLGFGFIGGVVVISVGCALMFWPYYCPACRYDVECESTIGPYCPQCGARALQLGDRPSDAGCKACNQRLTWGMKARLFKVRWCTHCGVLLDEHGI